MRMFIAVFLLANIFEYSQAEASPVAWLTLQNESEHNEKTLLRYIWPALKAANKSGRIYYTAVCQSYDKSPIVAFPRFEVLPPLKGETGQAAVRDVFRSDQDVTVTEHERGIVRIRIGNVPDAILDTKISALTFGSLSQYNSTLAIGAIESNSEVQAAMRKLGVQVPLKVYNMLVIQPAAGLPHLPPTLTDVTVDQALDIVATTFKGIVMYGACRKERFFDVTFAGGVYFDDRWLNTDSTPR